MLNWKTVFYASTFVLLAAVGWIVQDCGQVLEETRLAEISRTVQADRNHSDDRDPAVTHPPHASEDATSLAAFFSRGLRQLGMNLHHPLPLLLIQIIFIVLLARLFGHLVSYLGQPAVIGEILAGIVLGPSLLGIFAPGAYAALFPVDSLTGLQLLSQVGLVLFMFVIGMELDVSAIKSKAQSAVIVSHVSIMVPFGLGMCLALLLYPSFAPERISFLPFSLFIGIAMSITAFPVLARILQERDLVGTKLGTMAITCAAADDVTAWSLLAVVVTIARAGFLPDAIMTLTLAVAFTGIMIFAVRPLIARLGELYVTRESLTRGVLTFFFVLVFVSALMTELIGIHALFGAFLAGAIMPADARLKELVGEKVRDFSVLVLLPLFFAFTGLRTEIGLLNSPELWFYSALILGVAIAGKLVGSAIAARVVGESWRDSVALGLLMNTRGLMELIVLNIGYDLGILSAEIFAMMVLMALVTTAMAGPGLNLLDYLVRQQALNAPLEKVQIMLSFARQETGETLLRIAGLFNDGGQPVRVMHFTPEPPPADAALYMAHSLESVNRVAGLLGLDVQFSYKSTEQIAPEIVQQARRSRCELLLLGGAHALLSRDALGGKIRHVLRRAPCSVGVLLGQPAAIGRILVILRGKEGPDRRLLDLLLRASVENRAVFEVVTSRPPRSGGSHLPRQYGSFVQIVDDRACEELMPMYDFSIMDIDTYRELKPTQACLLLRP